MLEAPPWESLYAPSRGSRARLGVDWGLHDADSVGVSVTVPFSLCRAGQSPWTISSDSPCGYLRGADYRKPLDGPYSMGM